MNIICMLNLLKKNCSAVACQCTCVPSTKKRMSVSSVLHRSCDSDLGVRSSGDWTHTVSTSNSCCCPLQLFRVVARWVAMRSWSLVRLNTSLERSVSFLDKEKVFPRIDNVETSTTRSPARRFAARSLLVSCPPGTMVSSYRRSFWLPTVPAVSSERGHEQESLESDEPPGSFCHCSAGQPYAYAVGVSPDWCSPASLLPLVTRKVNCSRSLKNWRRTSISSTFCALRGSTWSVCGLSTSSALVSHVHIRPHGGPRVNRSRSAAPGNGR